MSRNRLKIDPCRIMVCKKSRSSLGEYHYRYYGKQYPSDKHLTHICSMDYALFQELDRVPSDQIPWILAGGHRDTEKFVALLGEKSRWGGLVRAYRRKLYIVPALKEMALPYLLARLQEGK